MGTIAAKATLTVSSSEFKHGASIPEKYTCEGENINPPIIIKGIPPQAVSLVLIMEDPDAPGRIFNHWIVWNIHPTEVISESSVPGMTARNSRGEFDYMGPCPPSGTHRYFFKVYALNTNLDLDADEADKEMIEHAMQSHIIGYGELMGLYKKHN